MLGKDRFQFESPNAIDAGEAPPSRPGRRGRRNNGGGGFGGTRSPRSVRAEGSLAKDERLFRGTKIKIEGSDDSSRGDEENPRRCSISTSGSFEEGSMLEFYEGDEASVSENQHDQLPSPDEARMYAAAVLSGSYRRNSDSESEEDAVWAAEALANEEAKPLSSSAIWRRPSRRRSFQARKRAMTRGPIRKSCIYMTCIIFGFVLLVVVAIAFFALLNMVSYRKSNVKRNDVNSEMVNSPRFLEAIEWLSEHDISSMESLTTANTPQFQAARWISDMDAEHLDIPVHVDMDADYLQFNASLEEQHEAHHRHVVYERFLQRYVLAVFFFALEGPFWNHDLLFLSENHECSWYKTEVANDGEKLAVGVTCNDKLLVVDIFIPGNNLKGELPSEIQSLRHLELLALRNNYISNIPTEIAHLSSTLEYLDLSKNNLLGQVPTVLGSLQELRAIGLAANAFTGSIPMEIAKLYKLVTLDLSYNTMLTGDIKTVIGQLVKLEYLYLEDNNFQDTLDDSFLINLRQLKELTLNDNQFKSVGQLPFHLISHQNLTVLDLSRNVLSGSLPSTFLSSSNTDNHLKFLGLSGNHLNGTVPESIQMLSNLEYLDVSSNTFTGGVPVSLGNLKKLTHCYMGGNSFGASIIPPIFFTDMNLQVLSLPDSQLTGMIPPWFKMLSGLNYLDLSNNRLTGTIPSEMWEMPLLSTLLLKNNMLSEVLPTSFPDSKLEILDLDNNDGITGDASGICSGAQRLTAFSYSCDKVECSGPCCHSECCAPSASDDCFSVLVSSSLQAKNEEVLRAYQVNRTISSFNPRIIRQHRA